MTGVLIDDGRVLQVPEIKHADGAVGADGGKHVTTPACLAEGNVVDLLVMGYQLCLDMARHHCHTTKHLKIGKTLSLNGLL